MIAIRIQNLNKSFNMPLNMDDLKPRDAWNILLSILGINSKNSIKNKVQITSMINNQAIRNVSLDIKEGSVVCLVGPSGSGKSVLLKILAGVIPPCMGRIEIKGRINSLLSIGDNLDSRLTAEENIQHYLEILRIPKVNFASYVNEIIEFAELQGFERVPVRTYSTGMKMRLSIALALHGNASIFIIDDVLGVGDIAFQQKCVERLYALKNTGCTLILSFSNEMLIRQLASCVVTLNDGCICANNTLEEWLARQHMVGTAAIEWQIAKHFPENNLITFEEVSVNLRKEDNQDYVCLAVTFRTKVNALQCRPLIDVMWNKTVLFRSLAPKNTNIDSQCQFICKTEVPTYLLNNGIYKIMLGILITYNNVIYSLKAFDAITIMMQRNIKISEQMEAMNMIAIPVSWEMERIASETI